jgi:hypothetical protein
MLLSQNNFQQKMWLTAVLLVFATALSTTTAIQVITLFYYLKLVQLMLLSSIAKLICVGYVRLDLVWVGLEVRFYLFNGSYTIWIINASYNQRQRLNHRYCD